MPATMAEIHEEATANPDAQSAVTDFLDYTEYLPADLIRSLALIRRLDDTYLNNADHLDELTQTYGKLPSLPVDSRPDAQAVRSSISRHLDLALSARESAYAEALRLSDLANRHQDRLKSIIAKLQALPKPPSRDPTPQPQNPSSVKRSRSGRKLEVGTIQRLTLKAPKGPIAAAVLPRPRHKRVTVPGEVLPPFDPDEPIASTEVSDWESDPPSPARAVLDVTQLKQPKHKITTDTERKPREPREITTYRKPTPPPEDAPLGSKHRPWTHLTEYEMYRLRKKMKKNHTWEPSEVMIRRELAEKGRGWENYWKAKAVAKESGAPFIDVDNAGKSQNPPPSIVEAPKPTPKPEASARPKVLKRTESKKDKREETPKDAASLAAQEAELAARRLGDIGSAFRNLFTPFSSALASLKTTSIPPVPTLGKTDKQVQKKRKIEETASASPSVEPEVQKKKQKLLPKPSPLANSEPPAAPPISAGTIKIPTLKLNVNNVQQNAPSATSTPAATSRPVSTQHVPSAVPKIEATPPPSRPPSRRSTAASVEPATAPPGRPSRRASKSVTPAPRRKTPVLETTPKAVATAASRRSKREAPGTVTQSSQDGGAAVSVSKRKTKPNKTPKAPTPKAADAIKPQLRTDIDGNQELVDPEEERYCICDDVSWGEMICCELDEKVRFASLLLGGS